MAKGAKLTKWKPKVWRPEYERAVAMSAMGVSNKEIARCLSFTPEFISMILCLEESKLRMQEFTSRLKEQNNIDVIEVGTKVLGKTLQRLSDMLDNEDKFQESPFSIIDRGLRVGEAIMKRGGIGDGDGNGRSVNVQINTGNGSTPTNVTVTRETDISLLDALRKSSLVKQLPVETGQVVVSNKVVEKEDAA